jgi:hypothetical protein
MPQAFSRWPTAATQATFSGWNRAAGPLFRSMAFISHDRWRRRFGREGSQSPATARFMRSGGLYGVKLGRAFFGESMFSRMTDASKVALAWLIARLKAGDFTLLDCQFITPHLESLGATTVSREHYVGLLTSALSSGGGGTSAGAETFPAGVSPVEPLPPPDFEALDDLLESAGAAGAAGPAGQLIAQLLGHTS